MSRAWVFVVLQGSCEKPAWPRGGKLGRQEGACGAGERLSHSPPFAVSPESRNAERPFGPASRGVPHIETGTPGVVAKVGPGETDG